MLTANPHRTAPQEEGTGQASPAPYLSAVWTDEVTGARGYLVVDRLLRGVGSGGLRMRAGCTLAEVTDLAKLMTLKEALVHCPQDRYRPFGGAKGGIDFDPHHPQAQEVLARYVAAMRPLIENHWAAGEDLGLRQADIDVAVARAGLRSSIQAALPHVPDGEAAGLDRLARAFAVDVAGVGLGDLVGGYGVAEAVLSALEHRGETPERQSAVVQGFGAMGGAAARYLAAAGVRVVGIADEDGVVTNPAGLDVERLLRTRTPDGRIVRAELSCGDAAHPPEDWLSVPCDVLVTAAVSYAIDESNQGRVQARYVVEAANASVVSAAETQLLQRGITVVPDFLANSAANSWWWWTLFGDIEPTEQGAFGRIGATMRTLCADTLSRAGATGRSPRQVARALAERNLAELVEGGGGALAGAAAPARPTT
ncbi:Glu/Leu/Phe/Val dehydrogenase dimerization domain-containing protein [Streptomyces tubercidicus]|uniref:Glu/Leu/Phe/Val dehydrogenase dimerization domain-containing protein n=1 Tax=Streptomyces tubercidicus TaxID=47759 RepID=UPI00368B274F